LQYDIRVGAGELGLEPLVEENLPLTHFSPKDLRDVSNEISLVIPGERESDFESVTLL
jgi:hypothetical protein